MNRATIAVCLLVAACDGGSQVILCDGGNCGGQVSWQVTYQRIANRKIDLLFVVDDTPAFAPFAGIFATGFADVVHTLETIPLPGPASLHVGIVRAGGCDSSARAGACGVTPPSQFARSEWCGTTTNFSGALADTLSCLADLGAVNCAPAQPLSAAVRALTAPTRPGWEGFLRSDAYLQIVIVAAGDDTSGATVQDVAAFVRGLKDDPSQAVVSAVVPLRCAAALPQRLNDLVQLFGANGTLVDLCDGQLAPAVEHVASNLLTTDGGACAGNVRDTDLAAPGLQASCTFTEHVMAVDGSWTDSSLPSCDTSAPPCWRLVGGGGGFCGQNYAVDIQRAADWCDEAGQNVTIECLGCTDADDPACVVAR